MGKNNNSSKYFGISGSDTVSISPRNRGKLGGTFWTVRQISVDVLSFRDNSKVSGRMNISVVVFSRTTGPFTLLHNPWNPSWTTQQTGEIGLTVCDTADCHERVGSFRPWRNSYEGLRSWGNGYVCMDDYFWVGCAEQLSSQLVQSARVSAVFQISELSESQRSRTGIGRWVWGTQFYTLTRTQNFRAAQIYFNAS